MLRKTFLAPTLTVLLFLVCTLPAEAALFAVSGKPADPVNGPLLPVTVGGNPADVQLSLANGFPIWYQETVTGLKLEMCLEQNTGFCLTGEPFVRFPISFPPNFGAEQFYWTADAATVFTSTPSGIDPVTLLPIARGGDVLVVNALEAGFLFGFPSEGDQAVFSRIRIRARLPVAGRYVVRHPFGEATYDVTAEGVLLGRGINQTQDIGNLLAPPNGLPVRDNFILALPDGPAPAEPPEFGVPAPLGPPRVDDLLPDRSIGPFLTWNTFSLNPALSDPALRDAKGNLYLGKPEQPGVLPGVFIPQTHAITGSPLAVPNNFFEITLVNDPLLSPIFATEPGFQLDAGGVDGTADNTITLTNFVVMGKVYNDGANLAPVANPDFAGGAAGAPVIINVVANDLDVLPGEKNPADPFDPANTNVHDIHPQAISLDPLGGYRTRTTTPLGGTVTRDTPFNTGLTSIRYQPADGFTGIDTFQYVVQDTGGLISLPAQVMVTVDDLAVSRASVRPKLMKWDIGGTSSVAALQTTEPVTNDPVLFTDLAGAQEIPPRTSAGSGEASVVLRPGADLSLGTADDLIDYTLSYSGLTEVQQAHIHNGAVGVNGGVNLFLCTNLANGPAGRIVPTCPAAAGTVTGTLALADFIAAGGVQDFAQLIQAIQAGNTYVNVHTQAFGGGELRGQLGRNVVILRGGADLAAPVIGVTAVRNDLTWSLPAKLGLIPGQVGAISAQSSAGGQVLNRPVKVK